MKTIGLIQARLNSERLPRKGLLPILGKPILWHMFHRLSESKLLDGVVISTGPKNKNKELCDYLSDQNIPFYAGDENDLIDRIHKTALHFNSSTIVRITGDCPFVDPNVVDKILKEYFRTKNNYDLVCNSKIHTYPHGLEVEVYPIETIQKLDDAIKESNLREWFPVYIDKHLDEFRILHISHSRNLSQYRLTIDYLEDYDFTKLVYQELYQSKSIFSMEDIIELLVKKPELTKINSKYIQHRNLDAPT